MSAFLRSGDMARGTQARDRRNQMTTETSATHSGDTERVERERLQREITDDLRIESSTCNECRSLLARCYRVMETDAETIAHDTELKQAAARDLVILQTRLRAPSPPRPLTARGMRDRIFRTRVSGAIQE
jgi:hypothetical protein